MEFLSHLNVFANKYVSIKNDIVTMLFLNFCNVCLFSYIYYSYFKETHHWTLNFKTKDPEKISYYDSIYFTILTSTTVFGDISPKNEFLRFLVILQICIATFIIPSIVFNYDKNVYSYLFYIVLFILLFFKIIHCLKLKN